MKSSKVYYVYLSFYRGILVYIGKGMGKRKDHTQNGKSNSDLINEFYFRYLLLNDLPLDTYIHRKGLSEDEALRIEKELIKKYAPYCNKCAGRYRITEYEFSENLKCYAKNLGYAPVEQLNSKFDFKFLFTPKGLLCQSVNLSSNSVFEYTGQPYHIRLKKELFHLFPEYGLQFLTPEKDYDSFILNGMTTKQMVFILTQNGVDLFDFKVSESWLEKFISSEHLDFADDLSHKKYLIKFDRERFKHSLYKFDSHVELFLKQPKRPKIVKVKKEKLTTSECDTVIKQVPEKKERPTRSKDLKYVCVQSSEVVEEWLLKLGVEVANTGKFINFSRDNKPYRSLGRISRFTKISEEEFMSRTYYAYLGSVYK